MVMVVLLTLLLLAGILATTMRLGLGSRQNVADQAATLQAQYVAESGVALARSRLRDYQTMLSVTRLAADNTTVIPQIQIPDNTGADVLTGWVETLCGASNWTYLGGSGYFDDLPGTTDDRTYPYAQSCAIVQPMTSDRFLLFAKVSTNDMYAVLPTTERPQLNEADEKEFWRKVFTESQTLTVGGVKTTTRLKLTKVYRLESTHFRVFLAVDSMSSAGEVGASKRVLAGARAENSEWWFDVAQPSLLDPVVMTDIHTDINGNRVNFTSNTVFRGPVHTNDIFAFQSNSAPQFGGKLTSAGCTNLATLSSTATTCTRSPGVRIGSSAYRPTSGTDAQRSTAIKNVVDSSTDTNYNGVTPNFAAPYKALPKNANNQAYAADGYNSQGALLPDGTKGLRFGSTSGVVGVQLYAGDSSGNVLTSYDSSNRKWNEPDPTYQYIRPITLQVCTSVLDVNGCVYTFSTTQYRADKDGNLEKKVGTGSWVVQPNKFNGVIFADNSLQTVVGPLPGRGNYTSSNSVAQARPALASFSGVTIASNNDIRIRSDLTMSQTPCDYSEYGSLTGISPLCGKRKNVLGIYSQGGSISITKQAPANVVTHAAFMASTEQVYVEGYNTDSPRGNHRMTGSIIEKYYGASGQYDFNSGSPTSGYQRDYSYDERFQEGILPPYFPISPTWIAEDASDRGTRLDNLMWKQTSAGGN